MTRILVKPVVLDMFSKFQELKDILGWGDEYQIERSATMYAIVKKYDGKIDYPLGTNYRVPGELTSAIDFAIAAIRIVKGE